jgi:predicted nucleic acid-binding protein
MIVIADTSGLIAASDKNAPESAGCQSVLTEAGTVLVSPLVLAETDHLAKARFGSAARTTLIDFIVFQARRDRFRIPEITVELLETSRQIRRKYAALDLDLADAVNVALAAAFRTDSLLTLDRRDFRAIAPLTSHAAFRLLPDDM